MTIVFDKPVMVFRNDYENGVSYSIGLSQKNVKGEFESFYKKVSFKKDTELDNKTLILPKNCFPKFYKTKDGKTQDEWFITDFEIVEQEPNYKNMSIKTEEVKSDTLDLKISDEDLPF